MNDFQSKHRLHLMSTDAILRKRSTLPAKGVATDREPLDYVDWHSRRDEVLDIDDNDELEGGDAPDPHQQPR